MGNLICEINTILAAGEFNIAHLSPDATRVFNAFPESIQNQLLLDRDPHGNVQISRIATERLLILLVKKRLLELNRLDRFIPRSHFFGYALAKITLCFVCVTYCGMSIVMKAARDFRACLTQIIAILWGTAPLL